MYKSPIDLMIQDLQMQQEGEILRAVQNVGIAVDKDELIKALAYDRDSYNKGFQDGREDVLRQVRELAEKYIGSEDIFRQVLEICKKYWGENKCSFVKASKKKH